MVLRERPRRAAPRRGCRTPRHPARLLRGPDPAARTRSGCSVSRRAATATSRSCSGGAPTTCGPVRAGRQGVGLLQHRQARRLGDRRCAARRRRSAPARAACCRWRARTSRPRRRPCSASSAASTASSHQRWTSRAHGDERRPGSGNALGYTARVRCGRAVQDGRSSSPSASRACGQAIRRRRRLLRLAHARRLARLASRPLTVLRCRRPSPRARSRSPPRAPRA